MSDEQLRMSDAERDLAAAALGEHYAQGRLTTEEHAERLDRIWSSRTRGELAPIFRDLPGTAHGPFDSTPTRRPRRGLPTPLLVAFAVLLVLTVVTHLPLLLIGLLVWFFVIARTRNRTRSRRW